MKECKEEKKEKKGDAKSASLAAQIIASLWMCFWYAFKFIKDIGSIDIMDIFISGLSIIACFSPVFLNLVLDKCKELRSIRKGVNDGNNTELHT